VPGEGGAVFFLFLQLPPFCYYKPGFAGFLHGFGDPVRLETRLFGQRHGIGHDGRGSMVEIAALAAHVHSGK